MTDIVDLLLARRDDDRPGLVTGDLRQSWREVVASSAVRGVVGMDHLDPDRPPHIGILLPNGPEFAWWLGGAALASAVVVGLNPTRRGDELVRDVSHTECQLIVTSSSGKGQLLAAGLDPDGVPLLVVDEPGYRAELERHRDTPIEPPSDRDARRTFLLVFTSGTSGSPKACICSQGRLAATGSMIASAAGLSEQDRTYLAMPMFHSNALQAGWIATLAVGGTLVVPERFSASGFLDDVRTHGVTYFNYVGKPLSYILDTPERADDAENPLRLAFGNEAAERDIGRFAERFGCKVVDAYGSTEGGVIVVRTDDMPSGALGRGGKGTVVLNAESGEECPVARFDEHGRLLNGSEAIGELASRKGADRFEGYWKNPEAEASRVRGGIFWSGDLAYRDERNYLYFAGRDQDWLRVDGENLAVAPIERILARHPDVFLTAVYAVPDEHVGDQIMAAVQLKAGRSFDPQAFEAFLAEQADLGTKSAPRFVRIDAALPMTATSKVEKRRLRAEAWTGGAEIWWRPVAREPGWQRFESEEAKRLAPLLDGQLAAS